MSEEKEVKKPRIVELEEKLKSGVTLSPDEIQEYKNLKKQIPGYADPEPEPEPEPEEDTRLTP